MPGATGEAPPEATEDATADAAEETPPQAGAQGMLTIGASPRARVLVDGVFVRNSPLFRHPVSVGAHTVTLQADTGEQVTFSVVVAEDREVKRMWSFEDNDWVKEESP